MLLSLALVGALMVQAYLHRKERDRLQRMAAANTPAERIASLLPARPVKREEPDDRPRKPLGL